MSANVTCTECGMVLDVESAQTFTAFGGYTIPYYYIPHLNEHMQLHEGGDHV